jgi:hypothetical protein
LCAAVFLLLVAVAFACVKKDPPAGSTLPTDPAFEQVYAMAQEAGYTGTLEELIELFKGEPGMAGLGITNVIKGAPTEHGETYVIVYSDGSTSSFEVLNGTDGEKGDKGDKGDPGATGADGQTPYIGENGNWWVALRICSC